MFKIGSAAAVVVLAAFVLATWAYSSHMDNVAASQIPVRAAPSLGKLVYQVPVPTPIAVLWVDSAGNLGLRGVDAVINGAPDPKGKFSPACRASATANGEGTVTVCVVPDVGKILARNLGGFMGGTP